jgi:hypothetical protein
MLDQEKTVESAKEQVLAVWERPEVRRIDAGEAEGAAGVGGDIVFS